MNMVELKNTAREVAFSFLGLPYRWGGDDPMKGFDCSGLCIELLKSVGLLPARGDWTAQGLKEYFRGHGCFYQERGVVIPEYEIQLGMLVFYGRSVNRITHVAFSLGNSLVIEAGGGGSRTRTEQDAVNQNAYVRVRPVYNRADLVSIIDPFQIEEED